MSAGYRAPEPARTAPLDSRADVVSISRSRPCAGSVASATAPDRAADALGDRAGPDLRRRGRSAHADRQRRSPAELARCARSGARSPRPRVARRRARRPHALPHGPHGSGADAARSGCRSRALGPRGTTRTMSSSSPSSAKSASTRATPCSASTACPSSCLRSQAERIRARTTMRSPLAVATRVDRRLRDGGSGRVQGLRARGDPRARPHGRSHRALEPPERHAAHRRSPDGRCGSVHRELLPATARRTRSTRSVASRAFAAFPPICAACDGFGAGAFACILPAHGGILDRPSRVIDDALLFYEVRVQRT